MGRLRLADIESRAKAATPGPWSAYYPDQCCRDGYCIAEIGVHGLSQADAKFIAAASIDIPALIAEVHRLRKFVVAELVAGPDPVGYEVLAPNHVASFDSADEAREHSALVGGRWRAVALVPVPEPGEHA